MSFVFHGIRIKDFFCQKSIQRLYHIHNIIIIRIGFVGFKQGELWIMGRVHTLITEHTAQFIYFIKSADNQALKR
ncbi:hypothetical protein SDC9_160004 [bioreactor metagenome]|uniref:Uncharacterized protein n=1 Tax=bioreactor metagenome TaxID=1076179 RepID=A0A645FE66_9ZZZZ